MKLICEGVCSAGRVAEYDAIVKRGRGVDRDRIPVMTDEHIALGRSLVVTKHVELETGFRCVRCGTVRQFGMMKAVA